MRHRKDHRKLGRTTSHREAMLRNVVAGLIEHGRIKTTVPKAKEARRLVEKCITVAKKSIASTDDGQKLHYHRELLKKLHRPEIVKELLENVAPKYTERPGGYTRILRAGYRMGDKGTIALFELV